MSRITHVEGDINAVVDESDSDEESEDEREYIRPPEDTGPVPTRVTYVGSGDDEEVIEYFGPPKHTGDAANTAKNSAGQASKDSNRSVSEWNSDDHRTTTSAADNENIVSLDDDFRLSEDIIAIQMDNNDDFFNEKPPVASSRSNSMSPNKRSSSPRAQSFKDDSLEGYVQITDDVFGIMYVPYNKAEHDDLFDEPEVDEVKEEMTNIDIVIDDTFDAQVGGAIEDEFAIAESEDTELAIQKALDHAKAISVRASTTMPVVDPSALASIDFSNTVDLDAPITLSNNEETSTNVRDAAKKAYHEIVEIYGTGMGDPSVLLMDESTGNEPNKSKTLSSLTSGSIIKSSAGINAIEEGDEEAAEREEIEDGVRQSLELQRLIEEKMRLESEWSKVGYIDSTDVSVYTEFDESVYSGYSGSIQKSIRPVSGTDTPLKHSMATVPDMNYRKALTYLKSVDYSPYFDLIKTQDDVTKSKNWFGFGGVKQLKFYGHEDALRLPFLIAQLNYDPYDIKHFGMLVSIYQALLGNKDYSVDLPLLGGHWEMIGFQGADPRTDLNRSMKMLSILLTLHMLWTEPVETKTIYNKSTSTAMQYNGNVPTNQDMSWPFMCVSVMFTKEAIQALRSGVLNDVCNQRQDVLPVLADFHHSCFFEFVRLIDAKPNLHHAVHLAAIRKLCETSPLKLLQLHGKGSRKKAAAAERPPKSSNEPAGVLDFDSLEAMESPRSKLKNIDDDSTLKSLHSRYVVDG